MALSERVFSLETEYGLQFYPEKQTPSARKKSPSSKLQRTLLAQTVRQRHGLRDSEYLPNGVRIYPDDMAGGAGHPECSLPECRSAREVVVYDKAVEIMLREAIPAFEQSLRQKGFPGKVRIFKNNRDVFGTSYGCHENYRLPRNTAVLSENMATIDEFITGKADSLEKHPFIFYAMQCLVPFLVTRQILCGSGYLKTGGGRSVDFHISQRADEVTQEANYETSKARSIFDVSRDLKFTVAELASVMQSARLTFSHQLQHEREGPQLEEDMWRLHLILGDANVSGWATWMKLGMTGIVLRMVEDIFFDQLPALENPVRALHTVASDPACRALLPMRRGRPQSAIEIQRWYLRQIEQYVNSFGASSEEQALIREWEAALNDLQADPMRLADRADWVFKKKNIEALYGPVWNQKLDSNLYNNLLSFDLRYHDIGPEGFFQQLPPNPRRNVVKSAEVQAAIETPPLSRAQVRSDLYAMRHVAKVAITNWGSYKLNGQLIDLKDPLAFAHPQLFAYCVTSRACADLLERMLQRWESALTHPEAAVRKRAVTYLGWQHTAQSVELLVHVVQNDQDASVRITAIQMLRTMIKKSDPAFDTLLHSYLDTDDLSIRLELNDLFAYVHQHS